MTCTAGGCRTSAARRRTGTGAKKALLPTGPRPWPTTCRSRPATPSPTGSRIPRRGPNHRVQHPLARARGRRARAAARVEPLRVADVLASAERRSSRGPPWSPGGRSGGGSSTARRWLLERPFDLVDADTGKRVPYQLSTLDDPQAAQRWAPERWALGQVDPRHLTEIVLLADDLPPMGYRTFKIVPTTEPEAQATLAPLAADRSSW